MGSFLANSGRASPKLNVECPVKPTNSSRSRYPSLGPQRGDCSSSTALDDTHLAPPRILFKPSIPAQKKPRPRARTPESSRCSGLLSVVHQAIVVPNGLDDARWPLSNGSAGIRLGFFCFAHCLGAWRARPRRARLGFPTGGCVDPVEKRWEAHPAAIPEVFHEQAQNLLSDIQTGQGSWISSLRTTSSAMPTTN